ncbi:MAG: hypothetical protein LBB74_02215 [Chitinispirillales bacterium]|jgi:hypothetical protein|nr:hypothetical protein [Chitinispirillales bacterium]
MADTKYRYETAGGRGVSGGVALRLVLCAVSLLVLGGAIFALMSAFKERKADDYRKALSKCDSGLQEAFIRLNPDGSQDLNWLRAAFAGVSGAPGGSEEFKGEPDEDGANFSVLLKRENRGDTLLFRIVSTGSSGSVTQVQERAYRLTVSGENDSAWVNEDIR